MFCVLISVWEKIGVDDFVCGLIDFGWEIVLLGGIVLFLEE